jgi:hypothetical protein
MKASKMLARYDKTSNVFFTIKHLGGAGVALDRRASVSRESRQGGDHGCGRDRDDDRDRDLHRAGIPWRLTDR